MCDVLMTGKEVKFACPKQVDIDVRCKITGKPITIANQYGMFCEDMCDLQEAKKSSSVVDNFIKSFNDFAKSIR